MGSNETQDQHDPKTKLPVPGAAQPVESAAGSYVKLGTISDGTHRKIGAIGAPFLSYARRKRHKRTFSEDEAITQRERAKKVEEESSEEEPEDPLMLQRDAKDWKGQDHYAVLGLSKYRYKATEDQVKRAHRRKVLRHHPDKRAAAGGTEDDSFFKCVQKATEILLDPVKRRQFDSVDEGADVDPPTKKQLQKGGNFFKLWGPVFQSESRFSKVHPVPQLGDDKSTKDHVENFYNFWYNFDSWRSFEYQDEDVPDDNENRDQKRHVERKNNNARKKKKTEDTARLRKLVDDCLAGDDRIKRFRTEERSNKNKKRLEREAAEKKAKEDAEAAKLEAARLQREKEDAEKAEKAEGKKAKEAAKNAAKKHKRVLKSSVKDANYFYADGDAPPAVVDNVLNDVELVMGKVDNDELASLATKLNGKKDPAQVKEIWMAEVKSLLGKGKLKDGDAPTLL